MKRSEQIRILITFANKEIDKAVETVWIKRRENKKLREELCDIWDHKKEDVEVP